LFEVRLNKERFNF